MIDEEKYVFETIFARRSIRNFVADKQVEKWKIIKLLEAAMAAPSAGNTQPWEFIVITEKDKMEKLKNTTGINAPTAIVTCANTTYIPWENNDWMIDCSAAAENMLIAATAMGLASLWLGAIDILREMFGIPDNIKVLNIIYFGYTDMITPSGTRYAEDAVYWEKYDPARVRPAKKVVEYGTVKLNDLSVNPPASWEN